MSRKIVENRKTRKINFVKYKETGWALQLWNFKIRLSCQQAYNALSFEWGPYNIV